MVATVVTIEPLSHLTIAPMNLKDSSHVHFTGIKGVGMTAVALCAQDLGITVTGSDLTEEFVTDPVLRKRHIHISADFDPADIPDSTDLLVYTGAHQGVNNPQVQAAKQKGLVAISQAEALAQLMAGKKGLSVCGVGGKSTTSAMIATIFDSAGVNPSFAVGVGSINPLEVPGHYDTGGPHFIAEADEYAVAPGFDNTPKFMLQHPEIIVATNIVHDHPDIYPSINDTLKVYRDFFARASANNTLIINADNQYTPQLTTDLSCHVITYSRDSSADYQIVDSTIQDHQQIFTTHHRDSDFTITLQIPGDYNAENALAAYIASLTCGLTPGQAKQGLLLFGGTKRRFEFIGTKKGVPYYDDYAHHPSELKAVLHAAKHWLPDKTIIAVFQPHTYSRTKALLADFAESFKDAGEVIITPIFASAREESDPTISSEILASRIQQISGNAVFMAGLDKVVQYLSHRAKYGDAVITIGAGDIYKLHQQL